MRIGRVPAGVSIERSSTRWIGSGGPAVTARRCFDISRASVGGRGLHGRQVQRRELVEHIPRGIIERASNVSFPWCGGAIGQVGARSQRKSARLAAAELAVLRRQDDPGQAGIGDLLTEAGHVALEDGAQAGQLLVQLCFERLKHRVGLRGRSGVGLGDRLASDANLLFRRIG